MAETVNKNDFVEIEFVARVKDGAIFDTNIPEEAKKINLDMKTKPLVVAIGKEMVLKGLDYTLIGKEIGKDYEVELNPEDAFGKRDRSLIKTIPIKIFYEKEINPVPGMMLNMDNFVAKIVAVSGGRVITDFNNPLAGKVVVYKFKIKKKVVNDEEKVNSLLDYFIGKRFKFKIEGKKIVFEKDAEVVNFLKEKFNEILGCEIEVEKDSSFTKEEKDKEIKEEVKVEKKGEGDKAKKEKEKKEKKSN